MNMNGLKYAFVSIAFLLAACGSHQQKGMMADTDKLLEEIGDKIPAQHKPAIEQALQQLKDAHKAGDIAAIDSAMNALNTAWQTASQQMYQGAGAQPGAGAGAGQEQGPFYNQQPGQEPPKDDNIQDADFEEVK